MATYTPAVRTALAVVDEDRFVRHEDGSLVTQSTAAEAIADQLDRLDARPGMRVLEIGTGSGYSTALIAALVGPAGHVTTVDVVPELVERAAVLLPASGAAHTTVLCRDGSSGAAEHGPFDRVIAWTTATHLPAAWVHQALPGGRIVAPVALATLSKTSAGLVVELDEGGQPAPTALFDARYVEMHGEVLTQWLVPPYGADVFRNDPGGGPWWLSAEHFRESAGQRAGRMLLDLLADRPGSVSGPPRNGEPADDFRAWLLATRPAGLCTAALGAPDWRIGIADETGAALTSIRDGTDTRIAGSSDALETLVASAEHWRAAGRPGLADLRPRLLSIPHGWNVRAELPEGFMRTEPQNLA